MLMKTKRKITRRRVLSFLLSVALLVSMLPLSGGQVAKAADGYPVTYEVKTDDNGSQYISITGMASNYADFIDGDGTLTFPEEIDGKPVKAVSDGSLPDIAKGTKLVLPASINKFEGNSCLMFTGSTIKEIYIMCEGIFDSNWEMFGMIYLAGAPSVTDIYFYPTDTINSAACIVGTMEWSHQVTVHVSSQTMLDKFNSDAGLQSMISKGALKIVKDLKASAGAAVKAKQEALSLKISQGEAMAEEDYTKASWSALQTVLAEAKEKTGSTDEAVLDGAIAAVEDAVNGLVSLEPIKKAISNASGKIENENKYQAYYIGKLKEAIAAAQAVPDDATAEKVAELAKAVADADKATKEKGNGKVEISWDNGDSGPIVPLVTINANGASRSGVSDDSRLFYYKDEACTTPAVGQDASVKPTEPGEYYLRASEPESGNYKAAISNVLKFTITERLVNWNGYQWDEDTRTLTITEDMVDFPNIMEVPWVADMFKINTVRVKDGVTLTRIGAYTFSGANHLSEFQIPSTVKAVGDNALNGCEYLEGTIALTDLTAGENAFSGCKKLQGSVSLADTMTEIPAGCFTGCTLESITLPGGVTAIGKEAFKDTKAFAGAEVILPGTVTAIGEGSFQGAGIASVRLPENLGSIGKSAFEGNPSLESIALPASLSELGGRAFASTGLKQIVIPATVQTIGGGLFQGCSSLSYVEFLGTGYDAEKLLSEKVAVKISGVEYQYDTMFDGTSPSLSVLCDGTTYDTLAGYAGVVENGDKAMGWPAAVLHKSQEYLEQTQAGYQADRETLAALSSADYGEAAWNSLQAAIAEAEAMLVDGPSNYDIITSRQAAQKKLAEGVAACLQDALDRAKAFLAGENIEKDYDTESDSWWDMQDAVEDAGRIIEENTAGVTEIIAQIEALKTAQGGLVPRNTDTAEAALGTAITAAKALAQADYTAESWKVLQDAIAEAEALKGKGTISQIEAAQKKVEDAKNALVKKDNTGTKPTEDSNGGTGTKPTEDPNGGTGTKPTTDPSGGTGVKPTTKPTAKPQAPKVKKATVKKAKSTKKKTIQVQWKKLSGVTGYQVQTALDKKFKKGKKTYTVKKAKTTKKTIKKLKRKKKYFVRVRAYKTVNGKKYYGSWSKAKSVKVK